MKNKLLDLYYKSCEKRSSEIKNCNTSYNNYSYSEYFPTIVNETENIRKILTKYNLELLDNAKLEGCVYELPPLDIRSYNSYDITQTQKISFDNEPPLYISKIVFTYYIFMSFRYKLKKYFFKKKRFSDDCAFNNMRPLIFNDIKNSIDYGDVYEVSSGSMNMTINVTNYKLSFGIFDVNISKEEYEKGFDIIKESIKTNTEKQLLKNIEKLDEM